ncbi:hypothetical protein HDU97_008821 [Phlyctochytrium planicorne]|nr:hypothetical protein HDU97_008821 [Phlyctochytrium planicorne]
MFGKEVVDVVREFNGVPYNDEMIQKYGTGHPLYPPKSYRPDILPTIPYLLATEPQVGKQVPAMANELEPDVHQFPPVGIEAWHSDFGTDSAESILSTDPGNVEQLDDFDYLNLDLGPSPINSEDLPIQEVPMQQTVFEASIATFEPSYGPAQELFNPNIPLQDIGPMGQFPFPPMQYVPPPPPPLQIPAAPAAGYYPYAFSPYPDSYSYGFPPPGYFPAYSPTGSTERFGPEAFAHEAFQLQYFPQPPPPSMQAQKPALTIL